MRLVIEDGQVTGLVVSRRNLITLLAKLDGSPSESERTIMAPSSPFFLRAEEDGEHYFHPERASALRGLAGGMHPDTEQAMGNTPEFYGIPIVIEPMSPEDRIMLSIADAADDERADDPLS